MLLEPLSYPSPVGVARVGSGWMVCCRWGFLYFLFSSLYFSKNYSLVFCVVGISTSKIIAWSSKKLSSYGRRPPHYGQRMRHLLIYKNSFLPCCWKHHRIFLSLVWRVSVVVGWIVVNEAFFSFLLFSLLLKKIQFGHLCCWYFTSKITSWSSKKLLSCGRRPCTIGDACYTF